VPEVVRLAIDQYQPDNAPLHKNWLDQRWAITWPVDDKVPTADIWTTSMIGPSRSASPRRSAKQVLQMA
jgi:hypothetical protein